MIHYFISYHHKHSMIVINITDKDLRYAKCASIKMQLFFNGDHISK
jgi:hypothetical protein